MEADLPRAGRLDGERRHRASHAGRPLADLGRSQLSILRTGYCGPIAGQRLGASTLSLPTAELPQIHHTAALASFVLSNPGPEGQTLGLQAGLLLLLLAGVPSSSIHLVTQVNHKVVERLRKSLAFVRKAYVEHVQAGMVFGGRKNAWQDVEVDETSFDKKLVPMDEIEVPERNMKWEQWVGMVQRGKPTSLVLLRLSPKLLGSSSDVTNCNEPLHA